VTSLPDPKALRKVSYYNIRKIPSLIKAFKESGFEEDFMDSLKDALEDGVADPWISFISDDLKVVKTKNDHITRMSDLLDTEIPYAVTLEEAAPEFMPEKNLLAGINIEVVAGGRQPLTDGKRIYLPRKISMFCQDKRDLKPRQNKNVAVYANHAFHECTHIRYGSFLIDLKAYFKNAKKTWLLKRLFNIYDDFRCESHYFREFNDEQVLTNPIIEYHEYIGRNMIYPLQKDWLRGTLDKMLLDRYSEERLKKVAKPRLEYIQNKFAKQIMTEVAKQDLDTRLSLIDPLQTFMAFLTSEVIIGARKSKYMPLDKDFEDAFLSRRLKGQKSRDHNLQTLDDLLRYSVGLKKDVRLADVDRSLFAGTEIYGFLLEEFDEELNKKKDEEKDGSDDDVPKYSEDIEPSNGTPIDDKSDLDDKVDEIRSRAKKHYEDMDVDPDLEPDDDPIPDKMGGKKSDLERKIEPFNEEFCIPEYNPSTDGWSNSTLHVKNRVREGEVYSVDPWLVKAGKRAVSMLKPFTFDIQRRTRKPGKKNMREVIKDGNRITGGRSPRKRINDRVVFDRRDYAILIVGDHSASTGQRIADNRIVLDVIKDAVYLFSEGCNHVGDDFAVYFFSSSQDTYVSRIKSFDESWSDTPKRKLSAIRIKNANRDGAMIRYGADLLDARHSKSKLFVYIGDGKPNANNYTGDMAIDDTAKAIGECRKKGIDFVYLNIDKSATSNYFNRLTQHASYARVFKEIEDLAHSAIDIYKRVGKRK